MLDRRRKAELAAKIEQVKKSTDTQRRALNKVLLIDDDVIEKVVTNEYLLDQS